VDKKRKVSPYERQLNLIVALLNTPAYLTAEEIRETVAGYGNSGEAFRQMFERDKRDIQSLGVPLQVGRDDNNPHVDGYRIVAEDYSYPPIDFSSDEMRTLAIAVQLFTEEGYGSAKSALDKLHTKHLTHPEFNFVNTRKPLSEEMIGNLTVLSDAAVQRKVVKFPYHTALQFSLEERLLEPWGIVADQGKWYCLGYDLNRDDLRVFRVSRIRGPVTDTGDVAQHTVPQQPIRDLLHEKLAHVRQYTSAVVDVQKDTAQLLVDAADRTESRKEVTRCYFDAVSTPWLLSAVLAEGKDAWVISPESLRNDIISTLEQVASGKKVSQ